MWLMDLFMKRFVLLCLLLLTACQPSGPTSIVANVPTPLPTPDDPGVLAIRAAPDLTQLPLLAAHLERVETALRLPVPILRLNEGLDDEQDLAQTLAIGDSRVQQFMYDPQTRVPMRSEVFGVYLLRESDITPVTADCLQSRCYRVEMYNYALNLYLAAVVDVPARFIRDLIGYENAQPDLPPHLVDIALEIATQSPEVADGLGYTPETKDALMANTKTALNNTFCQRSRHLCVAPTFVVGESALWAIVDLTEGTLVGVRWTTVGSTAGAITEKTLQNEAMMRTYCQQNTPLERDGWRMDFVLTSSDGLRISGVSFQDAPIIDSAKLVDWHVSYSSAQGFGYSDAVGCPVFSQAAVIAVEPPHVEDIEVDGEVVGFALIQEFWSELWPLPCNYRYEQRYEFYKDGGFRPVVASIGRGCGNDGTYRPVTRVVMAGDYTFSQWDGSAWQDWTDEQWALAADIPANEEGYPLRLTGAAGAGFYVLPSTGQFGDGGRGDNAYVYVTRHHTDRDEGDSDMPTIGPCCNDGYEQGPERFIDAEPIADSPLVLWYVAQLKNDDTLGSQYCWAESVLRDGVYAPLEYPCPSGPLFVPIENAA
jgi:hypothetical protein